MSEHKSNTDSETPSLILPSEEPRKGVPKGIFLMVVGLLLAATWYGYKTDLRVAAGQAALKASQQAMLKLQTDSDATIQGLTTEFTRAWQQIEKLSKQQAETAASLSTTQKTLAITLKDLDSTQNRVVKLDGELADLQQVRESLEKDLAETQQTVVAKQKQIEQVTKEKQATQAQLTQAEQTIAKRDEQIASVSKAKATVEKQLADAKQMIGSKEKEIADLTEKQTATAAELAATRKDLGATQQDLATTSQQKAAIEKAAAEVRVTLVRTEKERADFAQKAATLAEMVQTSEKVRKSAEANVLRQREMIEKQDKGLADLEVARKSLTQELAAAHQEAMEKADQVVADKEAVVETLRKMSEDRLTALSAQLEAARSAAVEELQRATAAVEAARVEAHALQTPAGSPAGAKQVNNADPAPVEGRKTSAKRSLAANDQAL